MNLGSSKFTWRKLGLFVAGVVSMANLATAAVGFKELAIRPGNGLLLDTVVMYPDTVSGEALPVVLMDHGFLLSNSFYREILAQIASQGFVVIAPQAYKAGGLPFGKPNTDVEAKAVAGAMTWFSSNLSSLIGQPTDFTRVGLVNHSRGSKVALTLLRDNLVDAQALAAIDPVDGNMDGTPKVTGLDFKVTIPTLIIGTGLGSKKTLGQACAPEGMNYKEFWESVSSPNAWLFVARDFGHMDFLDAGNSCGFICNLCAKSSSDTARDSFRSWVGSSVGDFLRAALYKDAEALERLNAADVANIFLTKTTK